MTNIPIMHRAGFALCCRHFTRTIPSPSARPRLVNACNNCDQIWEIGEAVICETAQRARELAADEAGSTGLCDIHEVPQTARLMRDYRCHSCGVSFAEGCIPPRCGALAEDIDREPAIVPAGAGPHCRERTADQVGGRTAEQVTNDTYGEPEATSDNATPLLSRTGRPIPTGGPLINCRSAVSQRYAQGGPIGPRRSAVFNPQPDPRESHHPVTHTVTVRGVDLAEGADGAADSIRAEIQESMTRQMAACINRTAQAARGLGTSVSDAVSGASVFADMVGRMSEMELIQADVNAAIDRAIAATNAEEPEVWIPEGCPPPDEITAYADDAVFRLILSDYWAEVREVLFRQHNDLIDPIEDVAMEMEQFLVQIADFGAYPESIHGHRLRRDTPAPEPAPPPAPYVRRIDLDD